MNESADYELFRMQLRCNSTAHSVIRYLLAVAKCIETAESLDCPYLRDHVVRAAQELRKNRQGKGEFKFHVLEHGMNGWTVEETKT